MRKVGDCVLFTGGAESTPEVSVERYRHPFSLQDGENTLRIAQGDSSVVVSPATLQAILDWYYERK